LRIYARFFLTPSGPEVACRACAAPQRLLFGEGQNPRKIGRKDGMEWSQSEVLSLAQLSCTICIGEGTIKEKEGKILPCSCVLRGVFRACYARFRVAVEREKYVSKVSFDHFGGKDRRLMWSRKEEEYMADFHLVSRRTLTPWDYRIFTFHFLLGADWKLCCGGCGSTAASSFTRFTACRRRWAGCFSSSSPTASTRRASTSLHAWGASRVPRWRRQEAAVPGRRGSPGSRAWDLPPVFCRCRWFRPDRGSGQR